MKFEIHEEGSSRKRKPWNEDTVVQISVVAFLQNTEEIFKVPKRLLGKSCYAEWNILKCLNPRWINLQLRLFLERRCVEEVPSIAQIFRVTSGYV